MNAVTKRYLRDFSLSMTLYVIVILGSTSLLDRMGESAWRIPIALSPALPIILMLGAFMRYLSGIDELQQRIQLMAIAFAAGAVGLLTFSYGFLETIGFPHLPLVWIFPAIIVFWGLGTAFFSRKYQ
jgi:hypothetical protein